MPAGAEARSVSAASCDQFLAQFRDGDYNHIELL